MESTLPPTYYDFLKRLRPRIVERTRADAEFLQLNGRGTTPVYSVDEYSSQLQTCLDELEQELAIEAATETGLSVDLVTKMLPELRPFLAPKILHAAHNLNHEYHSLVNFHLSGRKTFFVRDGLAHNLANTELNVPANMIRPPFDSCLFVYTSPTVVRSMYQMHLRKASITEEAFPFDFDAPVSVFVSAHQSSGSIDRPSLVICAWHARPPRTSHILLKRQVLLADGWSLENALRTDWSELDPGSIKENDLLSTNGSDSVVVDDDPFLTDGLQFFRIVLNTILYLSSADAEKRERVSVQERLIAHASAHASKAKRKKGAREAYQQSCLDYVDTGESVEPIRVTDYQDPSGRKVLGSRSEQAHQILVRGHWRNQPYGTNSVQRRITWIRPYLKGPDMATLVNKPYLVT